LGRAFRILLIEGHLPDAALVERALAPDDELDLQVVFGADDARKMLLRHPPFERAHKPDLILLDTDLPDDMSQSLLVFIRSLPQFRYVPVLLLSSTAPLLEAHPMVYTLFTRGDLPYLDGIASAQDFVSALRTASVSDAVSWSGDEVAEA
jgi:CheY-like chemotaxis protein